MPKNIIANKNFLLLWLAKFVSISGNKIYWVALLWWALQVTGEAIKIGLILTIAGIPTLIIGPFAGAWIDRIPRKRIIIFTDFVKGLIVGCFTYLCYSGNLTLYHIYFGVFLTAIANCFAIPAMGAIVPEIVDEKDLTRANSVYQMTASVLGVIGPALGGLLVSKLGVPLIFLMNAASFFFAAAVKGFLKIRWSNPTKQSSTILMDLQTGISYIRQQKAILAMVLISSVVQVFAYPVELFTPILIKNVFNMGVRELGFLWSSWSFGVMIASIFFMILKSTQKRHKFIVGGTIVIGICFIAAGLSRHFPLTLFIYGVFGIAVIFSMLPAKVLIQTIVPDDKRGRVFSMLNTIDKSLHPVAFLLAGFLIDYFSISLLFDINGGAIIVGGIALYLVKEIRVL